MTCDLLLFKGILDDDPRITYLRSRSFEGESADLYESTINGKSQWIDTTTEALPIELCADYLIHLGLFDEARIQFPLAFEDPTSSEDDSTSPEAQA